MSGCKRFILAILLACFSILALYISVESISKQNNTVNDITGNFSQFENISLPVEGPCSYDKIQNRNRGTCSELNEILENGKSYNTTLSQIQDLMKISVERMQAMGSNSENIRNFECMLCLINTEIRSSCDSDRIFTEELKIRYPFYTEILCQEYLKKELRIRDYLVYDCCKGLANATLAKNNGYLPLLSIKELALDVCDKEIKESEKKHRRTRLLRTYKKMEEFERNKTKKLNYGRRNFSLVTNNPLNNQDSEDIN